MIRRPPRSTQSRSSAASDVYKRQEKLELGSFTDFDRLFDVLSLAADQAEEWEAQLLPVDDEIDEPDVYDIFGQDDEDYDEDLDDEDDEDLDDEDFDELDED